MQIEQFTQCLANNTCGKIEQQHEGSNSWRKRGKQDGRIDFRMSSRAIYNLVRALTKPYVGAHIETKVGDVKVWRVEEIELQRNNLEPGKILKSDGNEFVVKTYDGAIKLLEHEFSEIPQVGMYL